MSGHTPGPWKVTYGGFTDSGVTYEIIMPDQRLTAFDASLIAAAPDLKEALEDALHTLYCLERTQAEYEIIAKAESRIRAALAKCAPGERP